MKIVGINIQRKRKERNITLRELAEKLDVSASFLSQVETGKASPSLSTLKTIADALQTTIGALIGEAEQVSHGLVTRESERQSLRQAGDKIKICMLTSPDSNKQMEPLLFQMGENAESGETVYKHFGQEFVLVIKGSLELTLNDTNYILKKGDSIYFNSTVPHSFRNVYKGETEALWVITPPTF
jgi:transcriptional regulator with XRE-family HTH domain